MLDVEEGAMYPALHRLERQGFPLGFFLLQQSPQDPKALEGFILYEWAWVDSNYRSHAYQICAERSWALVSAGKYGVLADSALVSASQRWWAMIQVVIQLWARTSSLLLANRFSE